MSYAPDDVRLAAQQVERSISGEVVGCLFRHHLSRNCAAPREVSSVFILNRLWCLHESAHNRVKTVCAYDQVRSDGLLFASLVHKVERDNPICVV